MIWFGTELNISTCILGYYFYWWAPRTFVHYAAQQSCYPSNNLNNLRTYASTKLLYFILWSHPWISMNTSFAKSLHVNLSLPALSSLHKFPTEGLPHYKIQWFFVTICTLRISSVVQRRRDISAHVLYHNICSFLTNAVSSAASPKPALFPVFLFYVHT